MSEIAAVINTHRRQTLEFRDEKMDETCNELRPILEKLLFGSLYKAQAE